MKKIISVLLALGLSLSANAQEAKSVFVQMPDSLSPLLTPVNRADCIDFLESKMKAQVENRFGRTSEMTALSKDYIHMQLSPQTTWQMKLLAINDSTKVICVVSDCLCSGLRQRCSILYDRLESALYTRLPNSARDG